MHWASFMYSAKVHNVQWKQNYFEFALDTDFKKYQRKKQYPFSFSVLGEIE